MYLEGGMHLHEQFDGLRFCSVFFLARPQQLRVLLARHLRQHQQPRKSANCAHRGAAVLSFRGASSPSARVLTALGPRHGDRTNVRCGVTNRQAEPRASVRAIDFVFSSFFSGYTTCVSYDRRVPRLACVPSFPGVLFHSRVTGACPVNHGLDYAS